MRAALWAAPLVALLSGCFQLTYLAQAVRGQVEILDRARPIPRVLVDPAVPAETRHLLAEVQPMKQWAQTHGLNATDNYSKYTDLRRPAAVWVVSACEPLRFRSQTWTFPIVGSVPYLGWFRVDDAKQFASDLRDQGLDVNLRTASTYSTLGWFSDPVLSTMLLRGEEGIGDLANTIFHESLHATLYLPGKTLLSESLASFVGDEMALDYMRQRYGAESRELRSYVGRHKRGEQVAKALNEAYRELSTLYAAGLPGEDKLRRKGEILMRVRTTLGLRVAVNNALISEFRSYTSGQPALAQRLAEVGRDWRRFIAWLAPLAKNVDALPDNMEKAIATLGPPG